MPPSAVSSWQKIKTEEVDDCSPAQSPAPRYTQMHEDSSSMQENTVDSTEHQGKNNKEVNHFIWISGIEYATQLLYTVYTILHKKEENK